MSSNDAKYIEKIVRAKVKLEGALRGHSASCPVDIDPEYMGPCKCGAEASNSAIQAALRELELK